MATTWLTNVFVAATPISSPARVYNTPSASRVACEPMMFVIASTFAPRSRAVRIAASVSAVSPDCEIPITRSPGPTMGLRYRYSEAISTSTGTRENSSIA